MIKAHEITELRKRLGWSMNELARYLQVSQATVSQWESGKTSPDIWRQQVLHELDNQVRGMKQKKRDEFAESLATAALTAGLIGFLTYLLTRREDNDE